MATMSQRVQDLAVAAGTLVKQTKTLLNGNQADLSALTTTAKSNLVAALNEVHQLALDISETAGAQINDSSVASTTEVWSITKTSTEIAEGLANLRDDILGGAGAAFDTLRELEELLTDSESGLAALLTALGSRVSVEADQGLTSPQKQNARDNIDVYSKAEIGNPDTDFAAVLNTAAA